jgi:hypothetical protein
MKSPMPNVQPVLVQLSKIMNQNPTFTFELSLEETNIILAALQEVPAKVCNPLSDKIKAQAQTQIAALQAAETAKEPEAE